MSEREHDGSGAGRGTEERPGQALGTWRAAAWQAVLPALIAWLPVLWPLPFLRAAGAVAEAKPVWAWGPLFAVVGWIWSRQVVAAVADDLGRRADLGEVDEAVAAVMERWVYPAIVILSVLIPLRYEAVVARRTAQVFRQTSGRALAGIAAAVRAEGERWAGEYRDNQAFEPGEAVLGEVGFEGPFASGEAGTIGKLVHDGAGRWWYIQDRPGHDRWSLKGEVKRLFRAADQPVEAEQWVTERGLVRLGRGVPRPRTTVWGMPLRQLVRVGHGWWWYRAGEPAELDG